MASPPEQPRWKRGRSRELRVIAADYEFDHFFDAATGEPCPRPNQRNLVVAAGIAKPDSVRALVRSLGLPVREEIYFPDHHRLSAGDLRRLRASLDAHGEAALLLTEKDWARWRRECEGLAAFGMRVSLRFLGDGETQLADFLGEVEACSISR